MLVASAVACHPHADDQRTGDGGLCGTDQVERRVRRALVRVDPTSPEAAFMWLDLSKLCQKAGERHKAQEYAARAVSIWEREAPGHPELSAAKARLRELSP